ncbi:LysR family transcriptional regulator [Ramlibacter albus]|uniref:LysR family transcriptional regulator n=1 Tax=Ramlibacter albus TaxID=2079448 RepID=A0A923S4Q6_9BURK|nr:LysR family transcriptional regulator [Ramlibacter albus]MBC5767721.1 LysR family transcriptional regulator [Ramlibacter albus]
MAIHDPAAAIRHSVQSRLKLRQLALLQAIDRHRTLNRVAAEMRLSQPAITKALREVEDIFRTTLFERSSRGLTPTPAGDAVLRYAQRWLAELESTSQVLAAIDAGHGGRVRMGMTTQVPQALMSAALGHLLGQRPRLSVFVTEGTTDQLVGRMVEGELDCAIGRSYEGEAQGIVQEPIYEQEPCLVVGARHQKRLSRGPLDWDKLAQLDWILPPPNTPMRRLYNTIFVTAGVQPPLAIMETISVRSMETVLSTEPNAIAILPRDVVDELFKGGRIAPLQHRLAWTLPPVTFFCLQPLAGSAPMDSLAAVLRDASKKLAGSRAGANKATMG